MYLPDHAQHAPVIFMVHGVGWRFGDKASADVVQNKVARWVARGYVFISVNYRMLPEAGRGGAGQRGDGCGKNHATAASALL